MSRPITLSSDSEDNDAAAMARPAKRVKVCGDGGGCAAGNSESTAIILTSDDDDEEDNDDAAAAAAAADDDDNGHGGGNAESDSSDYNPHNDDISSDEDHLDDGSHEDTIAVGAGGGGGGGGGGGRGRRRCEKKGGTTAAAKAAARKDHLTVTKVSDIPLQILLWNLNFDFDLLPHQHAAVRFVAGVPPVSASLPLHAIKQPARRDTTSPLTMVVTVSLKIYPLIFFFFSSFFSLSPPF